MVCVCACVCARPTMGWHSILGCYLLCACCLWDRLWTPEVAENGWTFQTFPGDWCLEQEWAASGWMYPRTWISSSSMIVFFHSVHICIVKLKLFEVIGVVDGLREAWGVTVFCGLRFYMRWKEWESWYSQSCGLQFSLREEQWQEDWAFILSLANQVGRLPTRLCHCKDITLVLAMFI